MFRTGKDHGCHNHLPTSLPTEDQHKRRALYVMDKEARKLETSGLEAQPMYTIGAVQEHCCFYSALEHMQAGRV